MQLETPEKIVLVFLTVAMFLLVAIYFPSFINSKKVAQETIARRNLLSIYEAELEFFHQANRYGSLDELIASELIDKSLSGGINGGYRIELETRKDGFDAYAMPNNYNGWFEAKRSFYINEKEVLTNADKQGRRADVNDEPVAR